MDQRDEPITSPFEEHRLAADAGALRDEGRLALLYKVGKQVLAASTLDDLNEFALTLIFDCLKAERGALLLRDPATNEFRPKLIRDRDGRSLGADELVVPTSIVNEVVSGQVGLLTSDALQDPRFMNRASVRTGHIRSVLCAPLWDEGDVLGVVYLDSHLRSYAFTRDDMALLNAIANLIAIRLKQDDLYAQLAEERVARSQLERYHSPDVVEEILARAKQGHSTHGGLVERDVTIMFADVKGFTPFAESLPPSAVADFLNEYYALSTQIVFEHGGTVNEFVGDSVMAIFGVPGAYEDDADRAVRAGIELLRELRFGSREGPPVHVRVAINGVWRRSMRVLRPSSREWSRSPRPRFLAER